eukprot:s176_g44.t1
MCHPTFSGGPYGVLPALHTSNPGRVLSISPSLLRQRLRLTQFLLAMSLWAFLPLVAPALPSPGYGARSAVTEFCTGGVKLPAWETPVLSLAKSHHPFMKYLQIFALPFSGVTGQIPGATLTKPGRTACGRAARPTALGRGMAPLMVTGTYVGVAMDLMEPKLAGGWNL